MNHEVVAALSEKKEAITSCKQFKLVQIKWHYHEVALVFETRTHAHTLQKLQTFYRYIKKCPILKFERWVKGFGVHDIE